MAAASSLPPLPLPPGISESYLPSHDLTYHFLSAGQPGKPLILCLHGFPELAFSWRKIMPAIAALGYHVVAYDQRGYGRTTGWDTGDFSSVDMTTFSFIRLVRDSVIFVNALGYKEVACVIGHDFGALSASLCALMRPDLFKSVIIMSHPFRGTPGLPFNTVSKPPPSTTPTPAPNIHQALAELPTPRKHYQLYYSTPPAASEMLNPQASLHEFLRGYFYLKSADWQGNDPKPLKGWEATEMAKLPYYYIMPLHSNMRESVSLAMVNEDPALVSTQSARWLNDTDLGVYVQEYTNTGFQGSLNWYRVGTNPKSIKDLEAFSGMNIDVPSLYIAGRQDWGTYQDPGAIESMARSACSRFSGVQLVDEAGHWVQQEQPEKVVALITSFLRSLPVTGDVGAGGGDERVMSPLIDQ